MKTRALFFFVLGMFCVAVSAWAAFPVEPYAGRPTGEETTFVKQWKQFLLEKTQGAPERYGTGVPFSFVCGERSSREWIQVDSAVVESEAWQGNERKHRLTWRDDVSRLECTMELTEFQDFPAFQWVVFLRNTGEQPTEPVHDFHCLDMAWNAVGETMPVLHRSVGAPGHENDFQFQSEIMHDSMWRKSRRVVMDTATNRQWADLQDYYLLDDDRASAVWLPFFNYQTGQDGLIVGLGWSGCWNAIFDHQGNGKSILQAGLDRFYARLNPGESVRSPLTMVMYWQGERMHGQNLFRQLVLSHYSPRVEGKLVEPPISGLVWGGIPTSEHLEIIGKIKQYEIPLDVYWLDAGWYGTGVIPSYSVFEGDWGSMAGDWRANPNWHQGTLRPIGDAARAAGMKFLLWVEPCRAIQDRPITLEHPEYFLGFNPPGSRNSGDPLLLDLANPQALQWAIDVVSNLVENYQLDWYEEDFNLVPRGFLERKEAPDRIGMQDIRFVEGHFAFWDALRQKYPKLTILNCASGGRRIDLESISRGQPLWRSDYNCFGEATPESTQDQSYGIAHWLPIQGSMIRGWKVFDTYEARCALSPGAENGLVAKTDAQWRQIQKNVVMQKACKKYFFGDYYPLTNSQQALNTWMAYQLYLPQEKAGMILAMRREKSDISAMTFDLLTIDPEKNWTFHDWDSGETWTLSGREIREKGFSIAIPNRRDSRLIFYSCENP